MPMLGSGLIASSLTNTNTDDTQHILCQISHRFFCEILSRLRIVPFAENQSKCVYICNNGMAASPAQPTLSFSTKKAYCSEDTAQQYWKIVMDGRLISWVISQSPCLLYS